MSDPRIEKLPKWAQDEFRRLQRDRDNAVRQLQEYEDSQTASPIFYDDLVCDGAAKVGPTYRKRFINGTNRIEFENAGVHLEVRLTNDGPNNSDGIQLKWSAGRHTIGEVAMIPESFQSVRLVSSENMRKR